MQVLQDPLLEMNLNQGAVRRYDIPPKSERSSLASAQKANKVFLVTPVYQGYPRHRTHVDGVISYVMSLQSTIDY
jgi:hypothetical protein